MRRARLWTIHLEVALGVGLLVGLSLLGACGGPEPGPEERDAGGGADAGMDSGAPPAGCAPACGEGERCSAGDECVCGDRVALPGEGPACGAGEVCDRGVCRTPGPSCASDAECDPGLRCCAGECVDLMADVGHCGACGEACELPNATERCAAGACEVEACFASRTGEPLYYDCNDAPGCETPRDPATCGGCGLACGEGERCNGSSECGCGELVGLPETGRICGAGEVCDRGVCRAPGSSCASDAECDAGLRCCAGECVDLMADLGHCGACGAVCDLLNATERCAAGRCELEACLLARSGQPLYYDCDTVPGCETTRGVADCGACGVACGAGERCNGSGQCVCGDRQGAPGAGPACPPGQTCAADACT